MASVGFKFCFYLRSPIYSSSCSFDCSFQPVKKIFQSIVMKNYITHTHKHTNTPKANKRRNNITRPMNPKCSGKADCQMIPHAINWTTYIQKTLREMIFSTYWFIMLLEISDKQLDEVDSKYYSKEDDGLERFAHWSMQVTLYTINLWP